LYFVCRSFLQSVGKFPVFCSNSQSCPLVLATVFAHITQVRVRSPEVLFVKNLEIQGLGFTLDFWGRIEHFLLMNTANPVQFYPRNPGLNLNPGSTNSSRIAPLYSYIELISVKFLPAYSFFKRSKFVTFV
jgi:hypothetical protein